MIDSEEFKKRLDKLCEENSLAKRLIADVGFIKLSRRLQDDALNRMNLERKECPYSGAISFHNKEI